MLAHSHFSTLTFTSPALPLPSLPPGPRTDYQAQDPWASAFLAVLTQELRALRPCLSEPNYGALAVALTNFVVRQLEALVWKHKFTLWGGLQLDKDVRALLAFFANDVDAAVGLRDRFSKLVQLCVTLQVEHTSELNDYRTAAAAGAPGGVVGAGAVTWRLSPAEMKQALSLRTDLSRSDLEAFDAQFTSPRKR